MRLLVWACWAVALSAVATSAHGLVALAAACGVPLVLACAYPVPEARHDSFSTERAMT